MLDLLQFQRPQRYAGNEWNVVKKNHSGRTTICIGFPDLYEIGMSNLGLRIVYGLLNEHPDIVCERVFMPAPDLMKHLASQRKKLFSLETKTGLDEFEIIGFHLGHELNYTNFLHILSLGGIPLFSRLRQRTIVIAAGITNPEPLADFVDVFFLGEFEAQAETFMQIICRYPEKQSRLEALTACEGFYVPAFYAHNLESQIYRVDKQNPQASFPLKRVWAKNLDDAVIPFRWLVPHTEITHDRIPVEIARGCPNRCTFCQARAAYFPYRERSINVIRRAIEQLYRSTGYENFSLLALSASDYSNIEALLDALHDFLSERKVGLSLPSLRADDIVGRLHAKLMALKKTNLTVAIEAASETLRASMNKLLDIRLLFEATAVLRQLGVRHIKLYFMFGLPQETEDDLRLIGEFIRALRNHTGLAIHVSANIFIPKPFSLWESQPMDTEASLAAKRALILRHVPRRHNVKITLASPKRSLLEAIISRADRSFGRVIYRAFQSGAMFDGYHEYFSWNIWEEAMRLEKIDYGIYLTPRSGNYPWSFIQ